MTTYLVTGSSRGLGLALISRLATHPSTSTSKVFATSRADNSPHLRELVNNSPGRVHFVPMDVTNSGSIADAIAQVEERLEGRGLDVLINNVGVSPVTRDGLESMEDLNDTFNTNVTATHNVTRAFLPLLRRGEKKTVTNISTTLGSMELSAPFKTMPVPAYKITKTALNMLTVQYALSYANEGFTFFMISPGWLQTALGGSRADLTPETGADGVLERIRNATPKDNGKFFNVHVPGMENKYDGQEVPW